VTRVVPAGETTASPAGRVVTAGETMALLDPQREGELELGDLLRLRFAGAESNFAIALAGWACRSRGSRGSAPTGSAR
jgi:hypothetical protein